MLELPLSELILEAAQRVPAIKTAGVAATSERLNQLQDTIILVKYGGNAMTDVALQQQFAQDVALLSAMGVDMVVVHGGGPQIDAMLKRVGIEGQFIQGMRVTDNDTMAIVDGVLCGNVQGQIVNLINQAGKSYGVRAVGVSGKDGRMIRVKKLLLTDAQDASVQHDIGLVGDVVGVDTAVIDALLTRLGSDKSKILDATLFLVDKADLPAMNRAWDAWVSPDNAPVRCTVQAGLMNPKYKIEIKIIAAR